MKSRLATEKFSEIYSQMRIHVIECVSHVSAFGYIFCQPFGRCPILHTLTSVVRTMLTSLKMLPLFRVVIKFCSTNRLFKSIISLTNKYDSKKPKCCS